MTKKVDDYEISFYMGPVNIIYYHNIGQFHINVASGTSWSSYGVGIDKSQMEEFKANLIKLADGVE